MSLSLRSRRAIGVVLALLGLGSAGCRESERDVSGDSWDCLCVVEPDGAEVDATTCALTAGEAAELARACVGAELGVTPRFCDCLESRRPFCELGDCVVR